MYLCTTKIVWCTVNEIWTTTDIFFSHFALLPSNNPKFLKNEIKPGDIIILHTCTKTHDHMLYCSWDMHVTDAIVIFHYGLFFALLHLEISSFYTCEPKTMIWWCTVPEIWCVTDGQTDGRTEKVTYRGGCQI